MAKQRTDTESVLKLVINGQQAKASVKELQETYLKLNAEINNMRKADDPRAYAEKATQVAKLKDSWSEARKEIAGTTNNIKSFNASFADIAKGVFGGNLLTRAWDMAVQGVTTFISKNAELSDSMAGVIKTTGLSEAAVDRLNSKFKNFDTRTTRAELLGLAQVAGKLGYSAEKDIEGFVRAADKIGVSLGEDLGGVEEAINSIGKLVDIFKISDNFGLEESLLKVGSAINELGASGTAKEADLIDFTQRLAGIAPAADISMQNVLGLAATLTELGQNVESSSTAVGQFIVKIGADIPKFSKIVGMSVKDFSKLLKEDANEAFIKVLEASNSAGGGIEKLATNMGLLDVSGAKGIAALGALSGNVDKLRAKQEISNKAFDDGTSILNEFNNVNNTLGANLEKLRNRLSAYWENSKLRSWLTDLTAKMIGTYSEASNLTKEFLDQKQIVADLETNLTPLITRYEELRKKGELSKHEQIEINKIISIITSTIPGAATEFNKYGQAIGFSTEKAREFIESQKTMLKYKNQDAIKAVNDDIDKYSGKIRELQHILETGRTSFVQDLFFPNQILELSDKARSDAEEKIKLFGGLLKGAEEAKKGLTGEDIVVNKPTVVEDDSTGGGGNGIGGKNDKKGSKSPKLTEAQKLQIELEKINNDIFLNSLESFDKETEAIRLKYEKLRVLAKGNKDQLLEIDRLEGEESELLINKTKEAGKKAQDELNEKKKETLQKIKELGLSGAELEIELERKKYDDLITLAEKYGIDISKIIEAREAGRLEIEAKYQDIQNKKKKEREKKDKERELEIREFAIESSKMVADAIFQIGENNRRARYDKEHSELEKQRDKELSNKNLTEAEKEAINKKYDQKATELKRKEFRENKRAAIAEAFINMALGIGKAIPNPFKMAFAGAAGLAQIAVISSQKFKKGGLLPQGSSHSQGGIDLWDKRRNAIIGNIEGGEPILSKTTYANNKEIVDELLYSSQRKAGASIRLNPEILDAERMVRNGGSALGSGETPVVNVGAPSVDFTPMFSKMDEVIMTLGEIRQLEVVFNDRAYQEYRAKKVKLEGAVNA